MNVFGLVAVICMVALLGVSAQEDKVSVQVYYESLCPDSIKFVTTQLYPTLQKDSIAQHVELELLPYGKSEQTYLNGWQFKCHHGPNECYGNTVQACALSLLPKTNGQLSKETFAYINCLMGKVDRESNPFLYPTRECAAQTNVQNADSVERCANSTDGQTQLSNVGTLTSSLKPALKSVPTIVFDKHFDQDAQDKAVADFRKVLCSKLKNRASIPDCADSGAADLTPTQVLLGVSSIVAAFSLYNY